MLIKMVTFAVVLTVALFKDDTIWASNITHTQNIAKIREYKGAGVSHSNSWNKQSKRSAF